ncbi:MAG TPA: phosphate acyltransferase, partial [Steroidobacteraceae bacterium]|nr:phosphate acyltransferase [Steroidobacteraceae bacterium]
VQFAVMGSVIASDLHGVRNPRVGLLNIGEEDIKGTDTLKEAHKRLTGRAINYVGFVEGDDIFAGEVDVVVTDGFTGNVTLKALEGLSRFISGVLREEFSRSVLRKIGAVAAAPTLTALKGRPDPRVYNGASMVGLEGVVIKSHGGADRVSFANAVRVAITEARNGVPAQIGQLLKQVVG